MGEQRGAVPCVCTHRVTGGVVRGRARGVTDGGGAWVQRRRASVGEKGEKGEKEGMETGEGRRKRSIKDEFQRSKYWREEEMGE